MLLLLLLRRKVVWLVLLVLLALPLLPQLVMRLGTWGDRYSDPGTTPTRSVAIVFGAGLHPDGTPSAFLQQRLDLAVALFEEHRVRALLVTGDNATSSHDEPAAMSAYLVQHGVPAKDVVVDDAGFSTYDSCYRAKAVFGVKDAVLVSQGYHLPRAVFTCRRLGIDAVGLGGSELSAHTGKTVRFSVREVLSSVKASWQLLTKPKPHFLGPHEPGLDSAIVAGRP
ncbi:MAG: rane protein [Frankiales bacterium]|nr:rane protein [Frankiales bacterium]